MVTSGPTYSYTTGPDGKPFMGAFVVAENVFTNFVNIIMCCLVSIITNI